MQDAWYPNLCIASLGLWVSFAEISMLNAIWFNKGGAKHFTCKSLRNLVAHMSIDLMVLGFEWSEKYMRSLLWELCCMEFHSALYSLSHSGREIVDILIVRKFCTSCRNCYVKEFNLLVLFLLWELVFWECIQGLNIKVSPPPFPKSKSTPLVVS